MSKKQIKEEYHLGENDLTAWVETKLGHLKPYGSQIALGAALAFAAIVGIAYFINHRETVYADQWRELNLATTDHRLSGNTSRLMNVAEDYPNQKAGMWSLQIAGDYDLRTGISQLSYDRENGFKAIERAKENLQKVVDAPNELKSTDLQRRSLFSLAYACETLGEFDEAKKHYQKLVDEAPDSAFAKPAARGLKRCENPEMIALYETFKGWKDLAEEAPGPNVPTVPNIDFPDVDSASTTNAPQSGGDFDNSNAPDTTPESVEPATAAPDGSADSTGEPVENTDPAVDSEKKSTGEGGGGEGDGGDGG
jgi:tetratricopeptide (TPR) repeat protein